MTYLEVERIIGHSLEQEITPDELHRLYIQSLEDMFGPNEHNFTPEEAKQIINHAVYRYKYEQRLNPKA